MEYYGRNTLVSIRLCEYVIYIIYKCNVHLTILNKIFERNNIWVRSKYRIFFNSVERFQRFRIRLVSLPIIIIVVIWPLTTQFCTIF